MSFLPHIELQNFLNVPRSANWLITPDPGIFTRGRSNFQASFLNGNGPLTMAAVLDKAPNHYRA